MRFENITSITEAVEVANSTGFTDGYLIFGLEVVVYTVLLLATLHYGKWKALTYSSFITGILFMFLNLADLAPWWHGVLIMVGFAIGAIMMVQSKKTLGD